MSMITLAKLLLALAGFQTQTPQTPGPMMWTGKLGGSDDFFLGAVDLPVEKEAAAFASALRGALAKLKTGVEIQRDFAKQLGTLDTLRAQACWSFAYPGKSELAAEIAGTRADWLEKLGRHSDAVFAAWHPFVMPEEKDKAPYSKYAWVASNGSLAELVNKIDALPAMVELHKRYPIDSPATKGGDAIEQVVRDSIEHGDPQTLKDFGARCVPALEKALREGPDELTSRLTPPSDPLSVLFEIDRRSAENLVIATLGKRGPAWTQRVLRAIGNSALTSGDAWVNSTDPLQPPRFDDPLTLQMIDTLAAQPLSSPIFFALLSHLVRNDAISPTVHTFLLAHLQATDPLIVESLRNMLDGERCGPNKRALYEAFLDSASPDLRRRCAIALQHYPVGPATLRATQHSDPNVRSNALVALLRHYENPFRYWGQPGPRVERAVPRTPEIEAALLRLAKDPEPTVRSQLLNALKESREKPPADVLEALLSDSDAGVRMYAAFDWSFDPELQAMVFERLARDENPTVLKQVAGGIANRSPLNTWEYLKEFQNYVPALSNLLMNSALVKQDMPWDRLFGSALLSPAGAKMLVESCVHGPHAAELVPSMLLQIHWGPNSPSDVPIYRALDASQMAEIFALQCAAEDRSRTQQIQFTIRRTVQAGFTDAGPFLALSRDKQLALEVRLRMFSAAAPGASANDSQSFIELLRNVTPELVDPQHEGGARLRDLIQSPFYDNGWPASGLVGFAPTVLADRGIGDMLALGVASGALAITNEKLDAASTSTCVERWNRLGAGEKQWADGILRHLDPRIEPRVLLIWRSEVHNYDIGDGLLSAMGTFQVDEGVDLVRGYISAMDLPSAWERLRIGAIQILTRRLDDLGADALLKAIAETGNEITRKACFDGLEQIRKYQDEKQSWQKRKGGESAREQAIADLLPMLGDKDANIRAAAARSLATLQAAEHLPKLVALLKDKDASVREAAQKALDALNSAGAKKP
jgi:HEAT repeat protein